MLERKLRLRKDGDFKPVYRYGQAAHAKTLSVRALSTTRPYSRTAAVVSNKVAKRAVRRNRIRRRIYGYLSRQWPNLQPGFDFIVVVHQDISALDQADLETELTSCLKRLGVLN